MEKKQVLLIGPLPPPYAGPEIGTDILLRSDLRKRFELSHINTTVRRSNTEKGMLTFSLIPAYLEFTIRLIKQLFNFPDIVFYLPTSATLLGWVRDGTCILISKVIFRRKLILQFRGGHFRFFYDHTLFIFRHLIRFLLTKVDLMLVQSQKLREEFLSFLPGVRVEVLPNAVETVLFKTGCRNTNDDFRKVLFVGHLSFAKGYSDLLKAIPEIIIKQTKTHFLFAGAKITQERNVRFNQVTGEEIRSDSVENVYNESIVRHGLTEKVQYLGDQLAGEMKLRTFLDSDIFVLPSYSEGFPIAVLEAMAAGLPVVTTPVGALAEIIQDGSNGFLINPGDTKALQEKILRLLSDGRLREEMGKRNAQLAKEKFDVSNQVEILTGFFNKVLNQRGTVPS